MPIKYHDAHDIRQEASRIVSKLGWNHVDLGSVGFLRSSGSSSKRTIARCHALSVPLQLGLQRKAFYTIEVISEKFDKMSSEDKIKVLIHELMHIPKSFGGGFIHHDKVCEKNINPIFNRYMEMRDESSY